MLRPPNLPTAWADVLLGYWMIQWEEPWGNPWTLAALLVASSGLYLAGMVWNDVFDVEVDRRERPDRPIPSGDVSLSFARMLAAILTLVGIGAAAFAGLAPSSSCTRADRCNPLLRRLRQELSVRSAGDGSVSGAQRSAGRVARAAGDPQHFGNAAETFLRRALAGVDDFLVVVPGRKRTLHRRRDVARQTRSGGEPSIVDHDGRLGDGRWTRSPRVVVVADPRPRFVGLDRRRGCVGHGGVAGPASDRRSLAEGRAGGRRVVRSSASS